MQDIEIKKHFVVFYSPGTFISEMNRCEIDTWDVEEAIKLADNIVQRYNATPYGFRFETHGRTAEDLNSNIIEKSNMYYLGGKIETYAEVVKRNDPDEDILRSNMKINRIKRIIVNDNSWRFTGPFNDDDILLNYIPPNKR